MAMIIPSYFQCGDCGQIEEGSAWKGLRYKCKHCQKANTQIIWPTPELRNFLEFIVDFDVKSKQYSQVVSVFLSSALELLLEELLSVMALADIFDDGFTGVGTLIDALLEGYQGRARMFALYSRIGYGTFNDAVKKMGKKQFVNNWDTIVRVRNNVVHGRFDDSDNITVDMVARIIADALYIFSQLHNQYNAESLQYRIALKNKIK